MQLPTDIASCHKLIRQQAEQLAKLLLRLQELEARLNQNSTNSSRPPSTDMVKPKRKPGIKRKPKSKGGQKGHRGNTLKMVDPEQADQIHQYRPERCNCGKRLLRQPMEIHARRQVFDLPEPVYQVTEYQQLSCQCPSCGQRQLGAFPDHIKAPVQYGNGVKAFIALLSVDCQLSERNISKLFENLYGHGVNSGTIQSALDISSRACEPVVDQIQDNLLAERVIHVDESSIRISKQRAWLHVLSNERWTYLYAHANRGRQAFMDSVPELARYCGVLVHDCWASYWSLVLAAHALCGAHLLRELQAQIEQGRQWARQMHDLLMLLYEKHRAAEQIHRRSYEWRQYNQIIKLAVEEEPEPIVRARGKPKKSKGRNLADRLASKKEAVLRFVLQTDVPFTNNQAERDIRPVKGKLKVAGCFRTWKGANRYARLQSVFSTWSKQGYSSFEQLRRILDGQRFEFEGAGC